ncbi:histidine kinase [Campylobacter sp. 19-13652]|uniref:histidine kinase n=1 Tax=Campylobacter sp. 19-13652 TaxID=2840180 RepID=UPI001C774B30|nr:histidine kinase [Campylobacter sp. 19-13652]BCX78718.1 hypothetical protein LBC_01800 [Campylobacter sp. 19-13652]
MINYKRLALKAIRASKWGEAKRLLSLAYEQNGAEDILFLISICALAENDEFEARMIFEFYSARGLGRVDDDLAQMLANLEAKSMPQSDEIDEQDAIRYEDFKRIVAQNGDFRRVFESIMFSTKVIISSKDDFLEFIQNLVNAGFTQMSMSYIESAAAMFGGDERIELLSKEIFKRASDENIY